MKKLIAATIVFAALGMTAEARAADPSVAQAPPAPPAPMNWTGFYVGVDAGYGWGDGGADISPPIAGTPTHYSFTRNGFIGGVDGGYNYQFNDWLVFGAEADFSGSAIGGLRSSSFVVAGLTSYGEASQELQWVGTVRGRIGVPVMNQFLVYATGGLSYGQTEYRYTLSSVNSLSARESNLSLGWVAGAGAEYWLMPFWTVRAEFLYFDLGSRTINDAAVGVIVRPQSARFPNNDTAVFRVGIDYHF